MVREYGPGTNRTSGWAGVLFPPHGGGEMEIWRLFPPHISRPWGGNSVYFPPIFRDPGGEIQLFPPHVGGKSGRRRRKILRIWRSEMLNFLYKNVFQRLKSLKFSACGGLFSCLDSFTKYIVVTETLKNFACGELLYVFLSLVCHASSVQIVLWIVEAPSAPRKNRARRSRS